MQLGTKVRCSPTILLQKSTESTIILGGAVARLLLQHPDEYRTRVLTRNPQSPASKELAKLGAEVVRADLTIRSDVHAALRDCWGVFGVTNFYDSVRMIFQIRS